MRTEKTQVQDMLAYAQLIIWEAQRFAGWTTIGLSPAGSFGLNVDIEHFRPGDPGLYISWLSTCPVPVRYLFGLQCATIVTCGQSVCSSLLELRLLHRQSHSSKATELTGSD